MCVAAFQFLLVGDGRAGQGGEENWLRMQLKRWCCCYGGAALLLLLWREGGLVEKLRDAATSLGGLLRRGR